MRVVWRDSNPRVGKQPVKYRGHTAQGYKGGWIIDVPEDENIYKSHYCALNAIDAALGGAGVRGKGTEKRLAYGIQIIGRKNNDSA